MLIEGRCAFSILVRRASCEARHRRCSFVCSFPEDSYRHVLRRFAKLREPRTNLEPLAEAPHSFLNRASQVRVLPGAQDLSFGSICYVGQRASGSGLLLCRSLVGEFLASRPRSIRRTHASTWYFPYSRMGK